MKGKVEVFVLLYFSPQKEQTAVVHLSAEKVKGCLWMLSESHYVIYNRSWGSDFVCFDNCINVLQTDQVVSSHL